MTQQVFVGSKSQPAVVVAVPGYGPDPVAVKRSAVQFARARHRIADPIPLSEHEAAVRKRQEYIARYAPKMNVAELNGPQVAFWHEPRRLQQFLENPEFYGN
jgi:hypothetical protein